MTKFERIFGKEKPIIALLHIRALPGDPMYDPGDTMESVVQAARADLNALQNGGVDAVLFSNEYSMPYQNNVSGVIIGAMARVIGELRSEIRVPFGVHVISDPAATIELAAAVGTSFVRSVFTGVYAGESGLRGSDIAALVRRKNELGMRNLVMLYMVTSESDGDLSRREQPDIAKALIFKCAPDGLCVSGSSAGNEPGTDLIKNVRAAAGSVPVLCNTGTKLHNVQEKLENSDGALVGTWFKKDGVFENMVDENRVREFMDKVTALRAAT